MIISLYETVIKYGDNLILLDEKWKNHLGTIFIESTTLLMNICTYCPQWLRYKWTRVLV